MHLELVSGLLLPLGIWLILSAGIPVQLHRRFAASALMSMGVGLLAFVAFGYALMHAQDGGISFNTFSGKQWLLAGNTGFFLQGVTSAEALGRFVAGLPLVLTAALLLAALLSHRTRTLAQALMALVVGGVMLPLAACWVWGNGWLQSLATDANLAQATTDLGHLATVGLVVGTAALVWLMRSAKRNATSAPEFPSVEFPIRAVAGVLCVLIASSAFTQASNAASAAPNDALVLAQFVNTSIAVSLAIVTAGAYAIFTTRKPDTLSAARAALAAVFVSSAGGGLLPVWILAVLGVVCGALATVGYYFIYENRRLPDDHALITSVLAPSMVGMLVAGLAQFGALGSAAVALQVVTVVVLMVLAWVVSAGLLELAERLKLNLSLPADLVATPVPEQPARVAVAQAAMPSVPNTAPLPEPEMSLASASAAASAATPIETIEELPALQSAEATSAETTAPALPVANGNSNGNGTGSNGHSTANGNGSGGLFGFLRRKQVEVAPKTPRKVAYPYRVGGRRVAARPIIPGRDGAADLGGANGDGNLGNTTDGASPNAASGTT